MPPNSSETNSTPSPDYSFITSPTQPQKSGGLPGLPGGSSKAMRIAFISGGVVILIIVFAIIKSVLFSNSFNSQPWTAAAQDQQAILHILDNATQDNNGGQTLAGNSLNFAKTAQLTLASSQSDLLSYMNKNKVKLKPQVLSLKVSSATDSQLSAASQAGTYDQTFRQVMDDLMAHYQNALKAAYNTAPGPKGRALIKSDYDQSKLLLQALDHPQS